MWQSGHCGFLAIPDSEILALFCSIDDALVAVEKPTLSRENVAHYLDVAYNRIAESPSICYRTSHYVVNSSEPNGSEVRSKGICH